MAIESFATLDDYEARYGAVPESQWPIVSSRLLDATALVLSEMPAYQVGQDEVLDLNVIAVCCEVVRRAICASQFEGITQTSQTAGSYNASVTFSNPDNALYLSSANKERLGLNDSFIGSAVMVVG